MSCNSILQAGVGSDLDYSFDWGTAGRLTSGETITTSTWHEDTGDLTLHSSSNTTTISTVFVTGGIYGKTYEIFNTIVTNLGRTDVFGFKLHFTHRLESPV